MAPPEHLYIWLLGASLWPGGAAGAAAPAIPADSVALQGTSPFLRLLGVPRFETGVSVESDALRLSLDIVNHADVGSTPTESIELDGESLYFDLEFRKAVTDRLSLELDVPFINHSGGSLDNVIESWHDLFGLSNAKRAGPSNELSIIYSEAGRTVLELREAQSGFGDVRGNAFWRLTGPRSPSGARFGLMMQVDLPTGDADSLFGNCATDVSFGLLFDNVTISRGGDFVLSGAAGITWPGSGDLIERQRRDRIGYGGVDVVWQAAARWQVHAALYGHTAGFDSALPELGRGSLQLAIAGRLALASEPGVFLDLGIVEDLVQDSTPDFTVQLSLRVYR